MTLVSYHGDPQGLKEIIKKAILHKGFSFIQILTPCVTFDKENRAWKNLKENVYELKQRGEDENMETALRMAENEPNGVGIFFQDKKRPHYQEILRNLNPIS